MSNYESIPVDTRNIIEDGLHLNDNSKNAIGRLWGLYLRVNTYDTENAERELQNFLNTLQQYIGQPETMLNVIDQKINDVERENNGNTFNGGVGLKKRKTGKKRKRTTRKTSKKRSKKRRKTLKGGKDLTPLYLNKQFNLYDENTQHLEMMRVQQEIQRQEAERRRQAQEAERRRQAQEEEERERQERDARQRREELERQERERQERPAHQRRKELEEHQIKEKAFWDQF